MNLANQSLIRLCEDHQCKSFDCGDDDLNDFYCNDAKPHMAELLSVTYIIESENLTIAFFSLLNDKISITDVTDTSMWNRFRKILKIPQRKRFKSYPAMKIGRLGVHNEYKSKGYGRAILDYLKILFISNNRTGCKFITVDAYKESISFYERNGFQFLTESDMDQDTRLMYFDLKTIA